MDNQLVPIDDKAKFVRQLNQATGMNQQSEKLMMITFNAKVGIWSRQIPEKDETTGYNKWEELGDTINVQIITTRKQYRKEFNSVENFYSKEFTGNFFKILAQDGSVVFEGSSKQFKEDPAKNEVEYNELVYVFAKLGSDTEAKLYKIKLSGSNLVTWFKYIPGFSGDDSVTLYVTSASKGKRMKYLGGKNGSAPATPEEIAEYDGNIKEGRGDKNKITLYYEIEFVETTEYKDYQLVTDRVNFVNEYLSARDTISMIKETFGGEVIKEVDEPSHVSNVIMELKEKEEEIQEAEIIDKQISSKTIEELF